MCLWEGTGTYYASARKELGPMSRTGKGLLGAPKVPTGRRLIAQPSSSSLGPWFWGALHIAAHQVHLLSTLGWSWSAQGKTSGSRPTHSDADHVYLTSPLYSCLASHRRLRAFPHAPCGNHGNYTPCRCQPNHIRDPEENTAVPPYPRPTVDA